MEKRQGSSPLFILADAVVRFAALIIFSLLWGAYSLLRGRSAEWDFNMEGHIQATLWVYKYGINSIMR